MKVSMSCLSFLDVMYTWCGCNDVQVRKVDYFNFTSCFILIACQVKLCTSSGSDFVTNCFDLYEKQNLLKTSNTGSDC